MRAEAEFRPSFTEFWGYTWTVKFTVRRKSRVYTTRCRTRYKTSAFPVDAVLSNHKRLSVGTGPGRGRRRVRVLNEFPVALCLQRGTAAPPAALGVGRGGHRRRIRTDTLCL
ncbi:hypothetical protein EVAR_28735_1 [Eumeta japonica]|uniref:Uncharacterized protein n=1 Tax=Eumeta variegata TaxID=151549 RepID=A0A4C1V4R8_EUMVA|nr:hypothetical protein EVAR_28735_1 [Eumeta japonica]